MDKRLHAKSIWMLILFIAVNCTIIYGLNYIISNIRSNTPYGLSENFLHFNKTINNNQYDIDFLNNNNDIVAIAQTNDSRIIGIYDPEMKYYINATKFTIPRKFRYFSSQDYMSKSNVAVVLDSIDQIIENGFNNDDYSNLTEEYNMDVINIFDYNSMIARNDIKVIKNLFSFDLGQIKEIYIDSENTVSLNNIKKELESRGFEEKKQSMDNNLIKIILEYSFEKKYTQFVLLSSFSTWLTSIITCLIYAQKDKKFIYISRIFGGALFQIIKIKISPFLYMLGLASILSNIISISLLSIIKKYYLSFKDLFQIQFVFIGSYVCVLILYYVFIISKTKKEMW